MPRLPFIENYAEWYDWYIRNPTLNDFPITKIRAKSAKKTMGIDLPNTPRGIICGIYHKPCQFLFWKYTRVIINSYHKINGSITQIENKFKPNEIIKVVLQHDHVRRTTS